MKVTDERRVQNEAVGDPGVLFGTVPLPINQVLESTSLVAYVQKPIDRIGRVVVDGPGGRRRNPFKISGGTAGRHKALVATGLI